MYNIATGKGQTRGEKVQALHIKMDANNRQDMVLISCTYSSCADPLNMPAGIQMRLVPLFQDCIKPETKVTFARL